MSSAMQGFSPQATSSSSSSAVAAGFVSQASSSSSSSSSAVAGVASAVAGPAPPDDNLTNVFNTMLLFTSVIFQTLNDLMIQNLYVNNDTIVIDNPDIQAVNITECEDLVGKLIIAYNHRLNSSEIFSNDKSACIIYDMKSLNLLPSTAYSSDDAINEAIERIAEQFLKYAIVVWITSIKRITEIEDNNGADEYKFGDTLFLNPLFNAYDGVFHGVDGIHDEDPRGDMAGSKFTPQIPPNKAKGGWCYFQDKIGEKSKHMLTKSIMKSSLQPTPDQSDDIAKFVKWDSLNTTSGHKLLDPSDKLSRLVCNIELKKEVVLTSYSMIDNSNRYNIIQVNSDKKELANTVVRVRDVYDLSSLSNILTVLDCAGLTKQELNYLASGVEPDKNTGDDIAQEDDELLGGTKIFKGGAKPQNQKIQSSSDGNILSGILDSSVGKSTEGLDKLLATYATATTGIFGNYVTFYLPHTRFPIDDKRIIYIYQRVIIKIKNANGSVAVKKTYKIIFEAWITNKSTNPQNYPSTFIGKSDPFEITEDDKCPGVNDTIRYILSKICATQVNTYDISFINDMYGINCNNNMEKCLTATKFFNNFQKGFEQIFTDDIKKKYNLIVLDVEGVTDYKYLNMAFIFRQKTMGDFLRLADAAYITYILWFLMNKKGIAIETTCDGYSSIKAIISNNTPIIYCGAKMWGQKFTIYSPFASDPASIERNNQKKAILNYQDKVNILRSSFDISLRTINDFIHPLPPYKTILDRLRDINKLFMDIFITNKNSEVFFNSACKALNIFNCRIMTTNNAIQALDQSSTNLEGRDKRNKERFKQININVIDARNNLSSIFEQRLSIIALFIMLDKYIKNILSYYDFFESFDEIIEKLCISSLGIDIDDNLAGGYDLATKNLVFVNKLLSFIIPLDILYNVQAFLDSCKAINEGDQSTIMGNIEILLLLTIAKDDYTYSTSTLFNSVSKKISKLDFSETPNIINAKFLQTINDKNDLLIDIFEQLKDLSNAIPEDLVGDSVFNVPQQLIKISKINHLDKIFYMNVRTDSLFEQFKQWVVNPEIINVETFIPNMQIFGTITPLSIILGKFQKILNYYREKKEQSGGGKFNFDENKINFDEIESLVNTCKQIYVTNALPPFHLSSNEKDFVIDYLPFIRIINLQEESLNAVKDLKEWDTTLHDESKIVIDAFASIERGKEAFFNNNLFMFEMLFKMVILSLELISGQCAYPYIEAMVTSLNVINHELVANISDDITKSSEGNTSEYDFTTYDVTLLQNLKVPKSILSILYSKLYSFIREPGSNIGTFYNQTIYLKLQPNTDFFKIFNYDGLTRSSDILSIALKTMNDIFKSNHHDFSELQLIELSGFLTHKNSLIIKFLLLFYYPQTHRLKSQSVVFDKLFMYELIIKPGSKIIKPGSIIKWFFDASQPGVILKKEVIKFVLMYFLGDNKITIDQLIQENLKLSNLLTITALLNDTDLLMKTIANVYFYRNITLTLTELTSQKISDFHKDIDNMFNDRNLSGVRSSFPIIIEFDSFSFILFKNIGINGMKCTRNEFKSACTTFLVSLFNYFKKNDSKLNDMEKNNCVKALYYYLFGIENKFVGILEGSIWYEILNINQFRYTKIGQETGYYMMLSISEISKLLKEIYDLICYREISEDNNDYIIKQQYTIPEWKGILIGNLRGLQLPEEILHQTNLLFLIITSTFQSTNKTYYFIELLKLATYIYTNTTKNVNGFSQPLNNSFVSALANLNFAKCNLLSKKIGDYLVNSNNFMDDLTSAISNKTIALEIERNQVEARRVAVHSELQTRGQP